MMLNMKNMKMIISQSNIENIDWLQSFLKSAFFFFFFFFLCVCLCHFLSLTVAVFVSSIPFHCFTAETTKGHDLSNHYKLYLIV